MFVYERYLPKELEILGSLYFQLICNYLRGVQFLSTIHPHQTTAWETSCRAFYNFINIDCIYLSKKRINGFIKVPMNKKNFFLHFFVAEVFHCSNYVLCKCRLY